jgi:lysophospholipase L1-like esterase
VKFCFEHNISLIQGLGKEDLSCFRDAIHLNEHGQKVLADALWNEIGKMLRLNE